MTEIMLVFVLVMVTLVSGAAITFLLLRRGGKKRAEKPLVVEARLVTQQVRAVGKLIGLEVHAKEIATARHGWGGLPPLLVSQARLAMIFEFEKQYFTDLSLIGPGDVEELSEGRFRICMPSIEGALRLVDVEPYDIQQGRVLGLVEVISMNAERQATLMTEAQRQAAGLFEKKDEKFRAQARVAVERQLVSLLELLGVEAELAWPHERKPDAPMRVEEGVLSAS